MSFISAEEVKKIARLANLTLTPEEETTFPEQLSGVLEYVSKLKEVDTSNATETHHVTGLNNITRDDSVGGCLPQDLAISQSPSTHQGFIKVKAIIEK